jgi:hypothetical protein
MTLVRRACMTAAICPLVLAAAASAQVVLFDNGGFITNPGEGFGGADASRTESGTFIGVANTATRVPPAVLADGFEVIGGSWRLATMTWYAFQTQTANFNTVNPFDIVYVRIFDGQPGAGANVIAGDEATNRLVSGSWSGAYRTSTSTSPAALQNQQRPIMSLEIDMSWVPVLAPGSYFVGVSVGNSALPGTAVFGFPVTPRDNGADLSEQFFDGTWFPGTLDFPFILRGEIVDAPCTADFNSDGFLNPDDLSDLITCFFLDVQFPGTCPGADFNGDLFVNPDDLSDYITAFFLGC